MDLTRFERVLILVRVTRIILSLLVALSLIGAPSPASAAASQSCSMPGVEVGMAADHEKMDCCTAECATACPSLAFVAIATDFTAAEVFEEALSAELADALPSINPASTDPPPRLLFT